MTDLVELANLLEAAGWSIEGDDITCPAWHGQAACRGVGAGPFFPDSPDHASRRKASELYRLTRECYCATCPVRAECAGAGTHEAHGMWGGLAPTARAKLRRVLVA